MCRKDDARTVASLREQVRELGKECEDMRSSAEYAQIELGKHAAEAEEYKQLYQQLATKQRELERTMGQLARRDREIKSMAREMRGVNQMLKQREREMGVEAAAADRGDRLGKAHAELEEQLHAAAPEDTPVKIAANQLLANLGHEIRTPLNTIIGFSDMLRSELYGDLGDPRYGEYADHINVSGAQLLDVLNAVLDATSIRAGTLGTEDEWIEVGSTVAACIRLVRDRAKRCNITLAAEVPTDVPTLLADPLRFKQILLSLLSNALRVTPAGGAVTVGAALVEDGALVLRVADAGVSASGCETGNGDEAGFGFGLARSLTELHGGNLAVESEAGRGTTVSVRFPPQRTAKD